MNGPDATHGDALAEIWRVLGGEAHALSKVGFTGTGDLPSYFAVSDLAAASVAAAGLAVNEMVGGDAVRVDRRLASLWFGMSFRPDGWDLPPIWDPIAGVYACSDGFIRLHTNAPHHRDAALRVLGVPGERPAVAQAVAAWSGEALEAAVVAEGGCAAALRTAAAWSAHPQGLAVAGEPLIRRDPGSAGAVPELGADPTRPLAGVKVLDLTRILAGPVATRFLAGFGAEVLRIDPPDWAEPTIEAEITLGKRCARLDLKTADGQAHLLKLLSDADVMVHGYRADALEALGLGPEIRAAKRPGLVDVSLCAYGWTGPLAFRRGFDSLVQMSCGIAAGGQAAAGAEAPVPLPVQALDHATGYMMAAAAVMGLHQRAKTGAGSRWRLSLARTAEFLKGLGARTPAIGDNAIGGAEDGDYAPEPEQTGVGPGHRLHPPVRLSAAQMHWDHPAGPLGAVRPAWA